MNASASNGTTTRHGNRNYRSHYNNNNNNNNTTRGSSSSRRVMTTNDGPSYSNGRGSSRKKSNLQIDTTPTTSTNNKEQHQHYNNKTSSAAAAALRSSQDLRSPGHEHSPTNMNHNNTTQPSSSPPPPDFITQTDRHGNATTPRSPRAIDQARRGHPSGPQPHLHQNKDGTWTTEEDASTSKTKNKKKSSSSSSSRTDECAETLLDSIRLMCCCLNPEESDGSTTTTTTTSSNNSHNRNNNNVNHQSNKKSRKKKQRAVVAPITTMNHDQHHYDHQHNNNNNNNQRPKFLPPIHPVDEGKKCLVLDLDETLVHSSFRAVPGADFVIPVQIEDVVHFVYVAKRPGVDEFLVEMAKHYEIIIYTASLNKYADPLLDLLDPHRTIRARLFRESCVYCEGNYVKDLSLLDRDLSQTIIVDNSPASYIFHPENAIDCSSFIDDPKDRELDQIGYFLSSIRNVKDVRDVCHKWRDWQVPT